MTDLILLTGSTGFVGRSLHHLLLAGGKSVRCAVRRSSAVAEHSVLIGEVDGETDWQEALQGVDTVIHLAGRAHILKETSSDPLNEFRRVNTQGTLRLAEQMIRFGSRRLVFVSTIGVNGNKTPIGRPFTEIDLPQPSGAYALSKWEAEQGLQALTTQLEIVTIRPPLVYGSGAPGNFARLVHWIRRGIPLPLGAVSNRRSLIAVQNLCDFLMHCAHQPAAAGETFLVSDGEDLSTSDLLRRVAAVLDCPARLLPVPEDLLRISLRAIGRERILDQLLSSLVIDNSWACRKLVWQPPLSVNQALTALREEGA